MGMPAKFAFSFCVRRAPYFCHENNAGFTYSKPREKSWNVPWWWGGERFGKIRQPFGYARRLVIGDVVDARYVALDRRKCRLRCIIDMNKRPNSASTINDGEAAPADILKNRAAQSE